MNQAQHYLQLLALLALVVVFFRFPEPSRRLLLVRRMAFVVGTTSQWTGGLLLVLIVAASATEQELGLATCILLTVLMCSVITAILWCFAILIGDPPSRQFKVGGPWLA